MARKPRVHFPGALYHVMARGNQGQAIFKDHPDRLRYLDLLEEKTGSGAIFLGRPRRRGEETRPS